MGTVQILSFSDDNGFPCCKDRKFVNGYLCPNFLCNTDQCIYNDDPHKKCVFVGTYNKHQNKKYQVQKVEECQCVLSNNLFVCSGIWIFVCIDLSFFNPFP